MSKIRVPAAPAPTGMHAQPDVPPEIWSVIGAFGLAAGNANVIMQLSWLPVGHGVARSRVESGRVDRHPIKRLRTTATYLAIALLGTEHERLAMRAEVNRQHAQVRSTASEPVAYNAFDPELQLWVAACLYMGTVDVYRMLHGGDPAPDRAEVLYQYCGRLATTLQVKPSIWPADRAAFAEYWQRGLQRVQMDDFTRAYLQDLTHMTFLVGRLGPAGPLLAPLLKPVGRFLTLGYLPEVFRRELGLPWSPQQQRRFERFVRVYAWWTRRLPRPLRLFPQNLYLADARRRIEAGRAIV